MLKLLNWNIKITNFQTNWNCFESNLVKIVDQVALPEKIGIGQPPKTNILASVKNKINKLNRLLKKKQSKMVPLRGKFPKNLFTKKSKPFFIQTKQKM